MIEHEATAEQHMMRATRRAFITHMATSLIAARRELNAVMFSDTANLHAAPKQ